MNAGTIMRQRMKARAFNGPLMDKIGASTISGEMMLCPGSPCSGFGGGLRRVVGSKDDQVHRGVRVVDVIVIGGGISGLKVVVDVGCVVGGAGGSKVSPG